MFSPSLPQKYVRNAKRKLKTEILKRLSQKNKLLRKKIFLKTLCGNFFIYFLTQNLTTNTTFLRNILTK